MLIIENLSIVIPILNENKNLINLTSRIHKNVKKINFEIIFVDDNSNDGSKTTLQKLKNALLPHLNRMAFSLPSPFPKNFENHPE